MVTKKGDVALEKGQLLSLPCITFDVSSHMITRKSLAIREYTGTNLDVGIPQGNGRFRLEKENQLIEEYLNAGKGIYLKGKVYFLESAYHSSIYYAKFKKVYDRIHENAERKMRTIAEDYLLHEVPQHQIPIITSIASLYDSGLFTMNKMLEKLSAYLEESKIACYLSLRSQDKDGER